MTSQSRPTDSKAVRVDNMVGHFYETMNYAQFKSMKGNRGINKLHVKRLVLSFKSAYLFSPICVNEKMEVVDGQHRLEAAKEIGLPVRYFIMQGYGLHEVHLLNANSVNWKKIDYLNGYCNLGFHEYIKMRDFMQQYPDIQFSVTEAILSNNTFGVNNKGSVPGTGQGKAKNFEEGKFVVADIDFAHKVAKSIMDFKFVTPFYRTPNFGRAIMVFLRNPGYKNDQLVERLKKYPELLSSISASSEMKHWMLSLESAYNHRSREKFSLRYTAS